MLSMSRRSRATMATVTVVVAALLAGGGGALALPKPETETASASASLWRGTPMDAVVGGLRSECAERNDGVACIKFKVLDLIDQALTRDNLQVSESVAVVKNAEEGTDEGAGATAESRGFEDAVERYVRTHDVRVRLPALAGGQTLTVSPRNIIDRDEITLRLTDADADAETDAQVEGKSRKRRKNKLKKILVPILVFVLLKAMTLIPLAIGVLGLKAWNALQLSFFSFLISISLAMFQLFKKIASNEGPPPAAAIHAAAPWQDYSQYAAARTLFVGDQQRQQDAAADDGQSLAYSAYAQ